MSELKLKILSFDKVLYENMVDMVVVPGNQGDISISSAGNNFAYILKSGTIYVMKNAATIKRFFVLGGNFLADNVSLIINVNGDLYDLDKIHKGDIDDKINTYEDRIKSLEDGDLKGFLINEVAAYKQMIVAISNNYYK